ncbi:conserved hypothetical protein [Ricinus communis]|uniref:Uncharacterized protein n=1 Tax=Ricinus communis TaxID=3988 RepID=B9T8R4_RICCO|nr:conserved hypothetical protein [Ricinus communis]
MNMNQNPGLQSTQVAVSADPSVGSGASESGSLQEAKVGLRYAIEIKKLDCCPPEDAQGLDIVGYRFAFENVDHRDNYLPVALIQPERVHAGQPITQCCTGYSLSVFESVDALAKKAKKMLATSPKFLKKVGDHFVALKISVADGFFGPRLRRRACEASVVRKINAPRESISLIESHSYICDLLYLEGPVLSLFRDAQRNWLYLWCDTDGKQIQRWLLFPVTRPQLVAYLTKESALLPLVLQAPQRLMVDTTFQDVFTDEGVLKGRSHHRSIKDVTGTADEIAEYLPTEESFFDEELAPDISLATELNPTSFDVPIDGQWFFADLDRFSKIYSQLYAFFYCTKPRFVNNLGGRVKRYLASPWTGGYSRINLFEALKGLIPSLHDLEIKQIRYASPGEIKIEALESVGLDLAHAHATRVHRDDALVKAGEAALVFGDQDRLEAAVAVARQLDPDDATIGDDRLAAGAVALVGLASGFGSARRIPQMQIHLRTHRAFDNRLVKRQHQILHLGRRHRPLDQLVQQRFGQFRQRPSGRCLRRHRAFLLHWHIHDFYLS